MKPEDLRYEDFDWKKERLFLGKEYIGVSYRQDIDNPKLFWLLTDRGESDYPYNISRVKDNGIKITLKDIELGCVHKGIRRFTDALKSSGGTQT